MEQFALLEKAIADWITLNVTIYVLIGVGLFLTARSLFVQVRLFPEMIRTVLGSRKGADGGISSFQAFAISLAARVGIGNVFGVAAALLMGGPGAIFWMWVVALVGMGTAFFEATLAQIFKVKHSDGSFRGGPAYYMKRGMKNRVLANIFAVITVVTCGIVITSVQSNAIAGTLTSAFGEAAKQPLQGAGGFSAAQLTIAGLIFVLAYSSVIAAYVYSDTNMSFVFGDAPWATWTVRVVCVVSATVGALLSLDVVWNAVDIAMAVMTITNLVALIFLSRWVVGTLKDYQAQRKAGVEDPVFVGHNNPLLPRDVPGNVWKRPKNKKH